MSQKKHTHLLTGLFLLFLCGSCVADPFADLMMTPRIADDMASHHDYTRQHPYPKRNNEIFLNPVPLMVPTAMKTEGLLQFALSRSADFPQTGTTLSKPVPWCMYNPHRTLESGVWYWRFRNVAEDGTPQEWSETYPFEMTDDIPRFVTADAAEFRQNLPAGHPRFDYHLNDMAEEARQNITSHPEYKAMKNRATQAVRQDFSDIATYYKDKSGAVSLNNAVNYLYQAYYLTQEKVYADKMEEILRQLASRPPSDKELFSAPSNFIPTKIAQAHIRIYDLLFDQLSAADRTAVEELLLRVTRHYYKVHVGKRENDLFDSHFWQYNMLVLFQCAYMLYDKAAYGEEVLPILEYYYEIWTARAPATGYNRDGVWHNSASYFNTNVETLYYMPVLLSQITGSDFLAHPWYRSVGRALPYTWPVGSQSCGFGDGSNGLGTPTRVRIAFADFIARYLGDSYAQWYAGQGVKDLRTDFLLRLDRMVNNHTYNTEAPQNVDKLLWYKDAGEVVMHSDLLNTDNNFSLSFRSSRYGCSQHTYANQNAFNVLYKGVDVFRNTGYYIKYASPHHIMSCRHTRAHNTILVNGIGQSFTPEAYGNVTRALSGDRITYCLGDASRAYTDTCKLKAWLSNFKEAGIEQSVENGFGATPLTRYLRHVWMLHPDIVVIYDELEASQPVRWDWLLHSPTTFRIEPDDGVLLATRHRTKEFATQARLFSANDFTTSQTDQFRVPPTDTPDPAYPNHWHLNATTENHAANRFLFIMQVYDQDTAPRLIERSGDVFSIGDWEIRAALNPDDQPSITITNQAEEVVFDYGPGDVPLPDGTTYMRQNPYSSVLYDTYHSETSVQEQTDYLPKHTRGLN